MMRGTVRQPKGLFFEPDFISAQEEQDFLIFFSEIAFQQVVIHDHPSKRMIKGFGYHYNETGIPVVGDPMPKEILFLRNRCASKANLPENDLASCLVAKYPLGAGVGWHSDARVYGSQVLGVSFNTLATMQFQQTKGGIRYVYELELPPRSFYIMDGESRYFWQHRIIPTKDLRYSITFRKLS